MSCFQDRASILGSRDLADEQGSIIIGRSPGGKLLDGVEDGLDEVVRVEEAVFTGNTSACTGAGAAVTESQDIMIADCKFVDNESAVGGAGLRLSATDSEDRSPAQIGLVERIFQRGQSKCASQEGLTLF